MTIHHKFLRAAAATAVAGVTLFSGYGVAQADPAPVLPFDTGSSGGSGSSGDAVGPGAPRLASVDNFRDVGGTGSGYAAAEGHRVSRGVFYRANAFTPSDADLVALQSLRLTVVYDLRTPEEIEENPDRVPEGAAYRNIPILTGDIEEAARQVRTPEEAREFARTMYRTFVTGAAERAAIGQLLTELADAEGPQVFHCNAGKDRTGWVAATLLGLAGVDRDTIMSDFLLSNEYSAASIKERRDQIVAQYGEQVARIYDPLLGVEASYLNAALAQMDQSYGSVRSYLTDGLGMTDGTVAKLRAKLLR
ncbi:tyrosine-protein phosphatase [Nocardia sp. CC227C]|uniref:tyrosine-protein phosphatase n=1 Tax=Nocardia sp. CC227C TaxID=3044562 RepID=UPI00278C643F|nr:tyrosine-protein phosphatase [Nocardia sp. CC227C]